VADHPTTTGLPPERSESHLSTCNGNGLGEILALSMLLLPGDSFALHIMLAQPKQSRGGRRRDRATHATLAEHAREHRQHGVSAESPGQLRRSRGDAPTGAGKDGDSAREGASGHAAEHEQHGVGARLPGQVLSKGGVKERFPGTYGVTRRGWPTTEDLYNQDSGERVYRTTI
jgi:hypothetical protein